jgi:acetyltransferase-like isoleucine patch superfamily enzyme
MVDTKIVVLKTRFDYNVVRLQAEGLKRNFFAKLGFIKPKAEEIQLVGYEKYCEPYIVIGGKYSLDYCKKHDFALKVGEQTNKILIAGKEFKPVASKSEKNLDQMIHLEGEEYAHYEKETFFVLDRLRREISPESFSFAPYEVKLEGVADVNLNLRKVNISANEIIELLRSKIAKRPPDLAEIIREVFEINENTIVYRPFFELTYHNTRTNKYVTLRVDGVSGEKVLYKFDIRNTRKFRSNLGLDNHADFVTTNAKLFSGNSKQSVYNQSANLPETCEVSECQPRKVVDSGKKVTLKFPANVLGEVFMVGDNVTAVVGDLEIPSGATVNDTLVVKGKLKIGDKCRLTRNVKVLGDVTVGFGTVINGNIVSGGNLVIGSNSVVGGCIKAAGTIEFGEKVVVGHGRNPKSHLPKESFDLKMIVDTEREKTLV